MDEATDLTGKRIVVVEDDYLLANDICLQLRGLGATILGPAPTPFYATQLIGRRRIDAAILDVRLHGTTVFAVADMLQGQGVPILFATASERDDLPARFRETTLIGKPLDRERLVTEIVAMTRAPAVQLVRTSPVQTVLATREAPVRSFARALARSLQYAN